MRTVIAFLLVCAPCAWAVDYGVGFGVDTQLVKDVNPDYVSTRTLGQFFAQVRFEESWTVAFELGAERARSAAGALSIERSTIGASLWVRYSFREPERWSPYLTLGTGNYFDRVTTTLVDESDVRRGTRWMVGAGGGVAKTFWTYLLTEAELRANFVREQRTPGLALILRVGALF